MRSVSRSGERGAVVNGSGEPDPAPVPPPRDPCEVREWCAVAVAWLERDRPEAALQAARQAVDRDLRAESGGGWGYRLASLAFERLGRDAEAVAAAEEAVRLAPGSWAARLRLGTALRRVPGRWRESSAQAARAARYAPEEPDPHVLVGDLALLRGEHRRAETAYRTALGLLGDHPAARVNLGLALLRWERSRGHHDPAWPVDPRETGRARHAMEIWSRQTRILLAVALALVAAVAFGPGLAAEARIGGAAVLPAVLVITFRQARRVRLWSYVPRMLARDPWLGATVTVTPVVVAAYMAAIATLPPWVPGSQPDPLGGGWVVPAGLVLLNGVILLVLRGSVEAWRGRPVRALAQFAAVHGNRTAARNIGVTLWLLVVRGWSVLALVTVAVRLLGEPRWALVAPAVPPALVWAASRIGSAGALRRSLAADRWLAVAVALLVAGSPVFAAVMAVSVPGSSPEPAVRIWGAGVVVLAALVAVFAARSAQTWWSGVPGPWRSSLIMCESCDHSLRGDAGAPVALSAEVRRVFTYARGVVLAYADAGGPRAMAVGAVSSVSPSGELRLIAADDAWEAAERDPRVAVFVADPLDRRFWAEVRGIAIGDVEAGVLRVTPTQVAVAGYPGRHQSRNRSRHRGRRRLGRVTPAE